MSISPIALTGATPLPLSAESILRTGGATGASTAPFASLVDRFLGDAVQSRDQAQTAVRDLALGRTDSLHEVMLQVAQADLSFRLVLEIRNRLTEAYQEIMKMQI